MSEGAWKLSANENTGASKRRRVDARCRHEEKETGVYEIPMEYCFYASSCDGVLHLKANMEAILRIPKAHIARHFARGGFAMNQIVGSHHEYAI